MTNHKFPRVFPDLFNSGNPKSTSQRISTLPNLGEISGDNVLYGKEATLTEEVGGQHLQLSEQFDEVVRTRLVLGDQSRNLSVDSLA